MTRLRLALLVLSLAFAATARADVPPEDDGGTVDLARPRDMAENMAQPDMSEKPSTSSGGCAMTGRPSPLPFALLGVGLAIAILVGRRRTV